MAVSLLNFVSAAVGVSQVDIAKGQNTTYNNYYVAPKLTPFPFDLPDKKKVAAMIFQFYQYDRPSILNAPNLVSLGSIALPLPSELIDNLTENYSPQHAGMVLGGVLESLAGKQNLVTKGIDGIKNGLIGLAGEGAKNLISNYGGQGAIDQGLSMAGLVQNPFLTMLFKSPSFKNYVFSWTFTPETPEDSATLDFILKKLRYHAMPGVNSSVAGALLNYPDMCVPIILPSGYMFDFKQCVIEGISINYVPGDTPAFYDSTMAPTSVKLTISLIEIEYWLKPDMTNFQAPNGLSSLTQAQQLAASSGGIGHQ